MNEAPRFVVQESADGKTWVILDEVTKFPFDNYDYRSLDLAVYACGMANDQRNKLNQERAT